MNFLAHIYLSGNHEGILIGNFIGDYVKGHDYNHYAPPIKKGIIIHRAIDSFTDQHSMTAGCKNLVRDPYGLYAGIVIDIFYDHFLATDWNRYAHISLKRFIRNRYEILKQNFQIFPDGIKRFFPYFVRSNWLESYATFDGVESVLRRMSFRTTLPDHSERAIDLMKENYDFLKGSFRVFFQDIMEHLEKQYDLKVGDAGLIP